MDLLRRNFTMRQLRFTSMFVAVAALSVLLSSCSKKPHLYPVSGKVMCDNSPAEGAVVTFYPDGPVTNKSTLPQGVVDAHGVFQISTFHKGDGAPAGNYKVTVNWTKRMKELRPDTDENDSVLLINESFSRPDKSGFSALVKAGPNELPAFVVERRKEETDDQ
jgi:hypothetical protein